MTDVTVGNVVFGNRRPFALIAGPCQMESRDHAFAMAGALKELCGQLGIGLVYKSSFDKANRTSANSARGIGLDLALPILIPAAQKFLGQDGHMVNLQNKGMAYQQNMLWIDDIDVQAKWYQQLKREWAKSRADDRPFVNPIQPVTLRWKS